MRLRIPVTVALAITLVAPAAAAEGKRKPVKRVAKARLAAFDSCQELVSYARAQALRTGGGSGMTVRALTDPAISLAPAPVLAETRAVGAPTPTAAPFAPMADAVGESFSGTNNQEAAVDHRREPTGRNSRATAGAVMTGSRIRPEAP